MKLFFPNDIWRLIWQYDGTYSTYFSNRVLPEISVLKCRELAADYFEGTSECYPSFFRFFQNSVWYTAQFEESTYGHYHITLYNETNGYFCRHLHTPRKYL